MRFAIKDKKFEAINEQTVWIGDPCYVIPDDEWGNFLTEMWKGDTTDGVFVETSRGDVFVWQTVYGDGEYPVERSGVRVGSCGVDAGLLSIMFYNTAFKLLKDQKELERLGCILENVSGVAETSGGDMEIGQIKVLTRDFEEEEM